MLSVATSELGKTSLEYGGEERVKEATVQALGALGADREFTVVSIRGGSHGTGYHHELLATVEGVLGGLSELKPPRQLVDLTYLRAESGDITAMISAQVRPNSTPGL